MLIVKEVTLHYFRKNGFTPVPSAGATPVKYAALSFGIEQGKRGRRHKRIFFPRSAQGPAFTRLIDKERTTSDLLDRIYGILSPS